MTTTYCGKHILGSVGDMASEWWTDKDWEDHRKYIEQLKEEGKFGEEVDFCMTLNNLPELDESNVKGLTSCRFMIFEI